jgi:hypothetical protein
MTIETKRPMTCWFLLGLACFQALSAVPTGLALSIDPTGGLLDMTTKILVGSPFRDFRIPGLILLTILGLGSILLATALFRLPTWSWATSLNPYRRQHWVWAATIVYGVAVMIWIGTQVAMIGLGSWLQPLYFGVGLTFVILPLFSSVRRHLSLN